MSIGRKPNTAGIGLENVGVLTERGAIVTDERMQTNVPGIYAVGDANGKAMLAHTAYREAEVESTIFSENATECAIRRFPASYIQCRSSAA